MSDSEFLVYQTEGGSTRVLVRLQEETVWLTRAQMAELFQTTKQNVGQHIRNVFAEGELEPGATVKEFFTVQQEGGRSIQRALSHYNLDVIISVGYRVRSHVGTRFRIWATQRLREYIVKGFALDDQRLKDQATLTDYFDELLAKLDDILRLNDRSILAGPGTVSRATAEELAHAEYERLQERRRLDADKADEVDALVDELKRLEPERKPARPRRPPDRPKGGA